MRKKIECLIRSGKSTKEIQEIINDFPIIITTEYFQKLGFDEIESIKLKWLLKKNDRIEEKEEKAVEARRELLKESSYRFSANANPNFVLLDTSGLQYQKGRDIVQKSDKVIIVESVLEEIDKKLNEIGNRKSKSKSDYWFWISLKECKNEISKNRKYNKKLDTIEKVSNYTDNSILYFLKNIPIEDRPTLLTADVILSERADCLGIEYILVVNRTIRIKKKKKKKSKQKQITKNKKTTVQQENAIETSQQESFEKEQKTIELETSKAIQLATNIKPEEKVVKNIFGDSFKLEGDKILIKKYNPNPKVYFVKDKQIQLIKKKDEMELAKFDYVILLLRLKHNREVRVVKLVVVNNKIEVEKERITFLNEIYQIEMPEEIQETARKLLLD